MKKDFIPTNLKTEYIKNPIGIDTDSPRLSWTINSVKLGFTQTAYQIIIASSSDKLSKNLGDIFDSGKVISALSNQIEISEIEYKPRTQYFWKVRVWDDKDEVSEYSEPAFFETGIMDNTSYNYQYRPVMEAKWICYPEYETPLFRKVFTVEKEIRKARAYICGLGYYEFYIYGKKVGENVLDPAQTDYEQKALYVTYDIKNHLLENKNTIGIILGNGWLNQHTIWLNTLAYGKPAVICEIQIEYSDNSSEIFITDGTFKVAKTPIINNNVYAGEEYDARLEIKNWFSAEYDDSKWENAKWSNEPAPLLVSQTIPPIKKIKSIKPVSVSEPRPGVFVFDMGQNFSGWAKLKVTAENYSEIRLRYAERLYDNGMLNFKTSGSQATKIFQTDLYICKGNGKEEIYEPRFTYHGFRYVEVTGFPGKPTLENIEGIVVHSDVKPTGKFFCSEEMINKIQNAALWTQLTNLHGIPTDCPHREKCGWLGDALITAEMTMYNFDMAQFWSKYLDDIETTRRGELPQNIAPGKRLCGAQPDWQMAFIFIPYFLYLYYGDKKNLEKHYAGMKMLADYLTSIAEEHIINSGYGDWCEPGNLQPKNTPVSITTTAFYFYAIKMMSVIAEVTGKNNDAKFFAELKEKIKSSFIKKFYDDKKSSFGSQCANAIALYLKLFPEGEEKKIAAALADDVTNNFDYHVSAGIFGTRYLYWALAEHGYEEIALKLLTQTTPPSIGHTLLRGETTLVERLPISDDEYKEMTCSLNHPMTGGFTAWFYQGIGGIIPDEKHPGFKHFYIKPQMTKVLEFTKVEFNSPYGKIISEWKNADGKFIWEISVPENTTATVVFPTNFSNKISSQSSEIKINDDCTANLKHGTYCFTIT